jgi:hypothetical protein
LHPGEWVEVRTFSEISRTLDSEGKLNGLPFMPEMAQYCEKRFPVSKRAEKTCFGHKQRTLGNAVHLANLRCGGSGHDGCQLGCLLFWREDWLKRVPRPSQMFTRAPSIPALSNVNGPHSNLLTRRLLSNGDVLYVCQATELGKLGTEIKMWNIAQYLREIRAGNLTLTELKQVLRWFATWLQWWFFKSTSRKQTTPAFNSESVSPGDLVEVRSKKEILQTLTRQGQNFGLAFSAEMLTLCGHRYRVVNNVRQMIDEETGKMRFLKRSCLTLDSATCKGAFKCCPRANFHFWRDEWLKKLSPDI